jgi:hypothetical protein
MDGELEVPEFNPRECVKQQITVPFLWEVKPGAPRRDWVVSTPVPSACSCPSPTPAKLVVSVPFQWEEKPLQEAPPPSLNPFVVEGDEEYALGFDLEAFGLPAGGNNNDASGAAAWVGGSWCSFSDSEGSSTDASAREFQFPRAPSERSGEAADDDSDLVNTIQFFPRAPSERRWEVANGDDQMTSSWSPPRNTATTLEELMILSRKLRCGQGLPVDITRKSLSSMVAFYTLHFSAIFICA